MHIETHYLAMLSIVGVHTVFIMFIMFSMLNMPMQFLAFPAYGFNFIAPVMDIMVIMIPYHLLNFPSILNPPPPNHHPESDNHGRYFDDIVNSTIILS
jgi:hypothetical protein